MGYNLSVACHLHKERVDILRSFECEAIRGFYLEHLNCYQYNRSNLEVAIDNNKNEPDWLKDGYYNSEIYPPYKFNNFPSEISWNERLNYSDKDRFIIEMR
jgi:hypothetical protein